ncbi:MAG: hypothetical protein ACOYZ8_14165 [Chloroflexota bacterium]
MQCPYCQRDMKKEGYFEYCNGKFLKWHAWLQYSSFDHSFQTKSDNLGRWFIQQGYRVQRTNSGMYDIYPRR